MFILLTTIEGVSSYEIRNKKVLFSTKGSRNDRAIYYGDECIIESNAMSFVRDFQQEIIFSTRDFKIYKKTDFKTIQILEGYSLNEIKYDDETIIVSKSKPNSNYNRSLYNIKKSIFIKEITYIPTIVTNTYEILHSFTLVKKVWRENNIYDWEIDLSGRKYLDINEEKDVTIVKLLGIEIGQLIVFMSNNELISIDVETGKILWETKDFIKTKLPNYKDYRMSSSTFYYGIFENGKLYQLDGNIYYSLDLLTQEVEILWEDKSEEEYLTCQYASYTEDYVYFTGSRNRRFSPYLLGAFNRKTLQLDWIHQPEGDIYPLTNVPHYVDGKLYILDSGAVLHIYEKE